MGSDLPKPLIEIAGRPMVEHLLDSIRDSEVDQRPILVVAPDNVELFGKVCRDQDCEYVIQEEQLGTGHAVSVAQEAANGAEAVLVLYGDHPFISAELLASVSEEHQSTQPTITMVTATVPNFKKKHEGFQSWGRIIRSEIGQVVEIKEVKDASDAEKEIKELNTGIYIFKAAWLWEHLPEIENKNASKEYYLTDLIKIAIDEGEEIITMTAKPFEVVGINTKEELEIAEEMIG